MGPHTTWNYKRDPETGAAEELMLPDSLCPGNYVLGPVPVIICLCIDGYYFLAQCNLPTTLYTSLPILTR